MDRGAAIIVIGDEILSGKYADENAAFLIGELRELGLALRRIETIPDDLADIADSVTRLSARFDAVFTSGGVGPTHDDRTIEGIALAFDTTVAVHPDLEEILRRYYGDRMTDSHRRLAQVPAGAQLVYGEDPVWPVVQFRNVYILPGVPTLFRRKFRAIRDRFRQQPFAIARVYVGSEESSVADALAAVVSRHPAVQFGSYPRWGEAAFKVVVTIESKDRDGVSAATDDLCAALGTQVVRVDPVE